MSSRSPSYFVPLTLSPIKPVHVHDSTGFFITRDGRVFGHNHSNPLYERQHVVKYSAQGKGKPYIYVKIMYKFCAVHRLLMLTFVPKPFPACIVDHIVMIFFSGGRKCLRLPKNVHNFSRGFGTRKRYHSIPRLILC